MFGTVGSRAGRSAKALLRNTVVATASLALAAFASPQSYTRFLVSRNSQRVQPGDDRTIAHFATENGYSGRVLLDGYGVHCMLSFRRAEGTASAPTSVASGAQIGGISAWGYGTTGYNSGPDSGRANVILNADETWTDAAQGASISFETTPVGTSGAAIERMRIAASGQVGIGTTAPTARLAVSANAAAPPAAPSGTNLHVVGADGMASRATIDAFGAAPTVAFRRADGTSSSKSALASGDSMGAFQWFGYGATAYSGTSRAQIGCNADEAWSDTAQGTLISFLVTPLGGTTAVEAMRIGSSSNLILTGALCRGAPVTTTADHTIGIAENWVINNKSGSTCTYTLPSASAFAGREIMVKNLQAQSLVSASANVVPLAGGAASAAILAATAGKWAVLVSDGTNWVIMLAN